MNIVKNGVSNMNIVVEKKSISFFAAEELQKYIAKISGCQLHICDYLDNSKPSIFVGSLTWCHETAGLNIKEGDLKYDGYCIKSLNNNIFLTSNMERGVLFAVYAILEHLGCSWYFPGDKGEILPSLKEIYIDDIFEVSNPDFEIRSMTDGTHKKPVELWKSEMYEVIDWSCKNKINSIFIHQAPEEDLEEIETVKSEILKRGMIFEYGGHGTQNFIKRDLFEQKPYLFREKDELRRKDGNFCASNDEAISIIVKGIEEVLKKIDRIDILHLFFDDTFEGSWCKCELCRNMSVPDQMMNVINKIYYELDKKYPELKGDMLLYHDTLEIDEITKSPHPNVVGYYAPRERCYAHSIGNPSCTRNTEYFKRLRSAVEIFNDNIYVFEYHADMILYTKMKIHIPEVLMNDLIDYKSAGVNKITQLMFLRYSWWAYEFNMFLFARATWNLNYDYIKGLSEYCEKLYPQSFKTMLEYYSLLEKASYGILSFCEYKYSDFLSDLREIPLQTPEFYNKHIKQIRESKRELEECVHLLDKLLEYCTGKERILLMDEKQILNITLKEAEAIYLQMTAFYLFGMDKNIDIETAKTYVDKAICCKHDMIKLIETIPDELKGNAGKDSIFVDHLCKDQIKFLCKLKEDFEEKYKDRRIK